MRQDLVDGAPTQLVGLPDEDGTDPVVVVVCDSGRASNRGIYAFSHFATATQDQQRA